MTDSLTRLAMAQRQIGLAAGEPPTTKGYPPSVFTMLPRLLERRAWRRWSRHHHLCQHHFVEGDDMNDPVGDTVRGIVDGHVVLSRRLVSYGHYPPIDVLESLSRTMPSTCTEEHITAATRIVGSWRSTKRMKNSSVLGHTRREVMLRLTRPSS